MQVQAVIREGIIRIDKPRSGSNSLAGEISEARTKFKRIVRVLKAAARNAEAMERWRSRDRQKVC
jgi:hypothetical protein